MVFFAAGSFDLTGERNLAVLREVGRYFVGAYWSDVGEWNGQVFLASHTDRGEAPDASLPLARERGEAVRRQLVGLGVPAGQLAVGAYGESRLLVPTEPGVLEPKNRRVEITFVRPLDWPR